MATKFKPLGELPKDSDDDDDDEDEDDIDDNDEETVKPVAASGKNKTASKVQLKNVPAEYKTVIDVEGKEMTFDEYLVWLGNAVLAIKRSVA